MAAPLGNHNGRGRKGRSGRKGYGIEKNNAEILHDMFFTDQGRNETLDKLKTGKYSLKDVFVSKAYSGNERILLALFNKNFPDAALKGEAARDETFLEAIKEAKRIREGKAAGEVPEKVKSIEDVLALLEDTIKRVRTEPMTLDQANSLGRLANTAIKAIEVGELSEKLDLLNSVVQERKAKMKK